MASCDRQAIIRSCTLNAWLRCVFTYDTMFGCRWQCSELIMVITRHSGERHHQQARALPVLLHMM